MNLLAGNIFMQGTPDTSAYMIAGFAVIFGVMLIYLVSLALRKRRLQHEEELLKELAQGEKK